MPCRIFGDLNFALHGLTDGNNIVKGIFGGETLADEAAPQLAPVLEGLEAEAVTISVPVVPLLPVISL